MTMTINPSSTISKVFYQGNQQSVQIPANFHFDTDMVKISQTATGLLIEPVLEQVTDLSKGEEFLALFKGFPNDFIQAVEDRDMSPTTRA